MSRPYRRCRMRAISVLRDYPNLAAIQAEAQRQTVTSTFSGAPAGCGFGRKTERAALRSELSDQEEKELEAVRKTISAVERWRDGRDCLKIVELVDWRQSHGLEGAAMIVHVSRATASRMRLRVLDELEKYLGYR